MIVKTIITICLFTSLLYFHCVTAMNTSLTRFLDEHQKCQNASIKKLTDEKLCDNLYKRINTEQHFDFKKNKTQCFDFWNFVVCSEKVMFNTTECKEFEAELKDVTLTATCEMKTKVCDLSSFSGSLSTALSVGVLAVMFFHLFV